MTPFGAQFLTSLRQHRMSVPSLIVRLDCEPEPVPSWWLARGYSAGDWWLYAPEIVVEAAQPIYRLDLRAVAGMTVTAVQHGTNDERFGQLIDRLFACGAAAVHAVRGDSVTVITDGGRRIAA